MRIMTLYCCNQKIVNTIYTSNMSANCGAAVAEIVSMAVINNK